MKEIQPEIVGNILSVYSQRSNQHLPRHGLLGVTALTGAKRGFWAGLENLAPRNCAWTCSEPRKDAVFFDVGHIFSEPRNEKLMLDMSGRLHHGLGFRSADPIMLW